MAWAEFRSRLLLHAAKSPVVRWAAPDRRERGSVSRVVSQLFISSVGNVVKFILIQLQCILIFRGVYV